MKSPETIKSLMAIIILLSFSEMSAAESWTKDNACQECRTGVVYRFYIEMPRDQAWEKLKDLTLAPNYVPGVEGIEMLTEKSQGVGASRRIYPQNMDETVIEWNEGHGFVMKLHNPGGRTIAPFKAAAFRYSISERDKGTEFTLTMMYKMKWGIIGSIADHMLIRSFVERRIRDIGLSMKHYYLTGEAVAPETLRKIRKADQRNSDA